MLSEKNPDSKGQVHSGKSKILTEKKSAVTSGERRGRGLQRSMGKFSE